MDAQQALDRKARLLHSAATDAGRTLAAALVSGATPSSTVWGLLDVTGADEKASAGWTRRPSSCTRRSTPPPSTPPPSSACSTWWAPAGLRCTWTSTASGAASPSSSGPLSGVYAATTKPGGLVDTVFREYTLTAEQAVGVRRDRRLRRHAEEVRRPTRTSRWHLPRDLSAQHLRGGRALAKNLPIASCHFEVDKQSCCARAATTRCR
jgi:hypothetical protein